MMRSPQRESPLGLLELVAIALGGMVGGGIFSILGVSVAQVGVFTPLAIAIGGVAAALAAYSYVRLALYFRDEGATYSFFARSFPGHRLAASMIGWWVVFGYISTIALYAFTFAAYAISPLPFADDPWVRRLVGIGVILVFAAVNAWSTRGLGRLEDLLVYSKIAILVVVAGVLWGNGRARLPALIEETEAFSGFELVTIAALTFVAFEGFQLVIHAMNEMRDPERNIPRSIYLSVAIVTVVYVFIATGAIRAIPFADIIERQEYALAAGASDLLGPIGGEIVVAGALLATMSAIGGTLFGAARLMAVIAADGNLPATLAKRHRHIPRRAIAVMTVAACALLLVADLRLIIEFGSITFLLVSWLMAVANHRLREETGSHPVLTIAALVTLAAGVVLIVIYEARIHPPQLAFIVGLYAALALGCWLFTRFVARREALGAD